MTAPAGIEAVIEGVRTFVNQFNEVPDLQFGSVPYDLRSHKGTGYLLMVASINQSAPAEFVRDFVGHLHSEFGDALLAFHDLPEAERRKVGHAYVQKHLPDWKLNDAWDRILTDASRCITTSRQRSPAGMTLAHTAPMHAQRMAALLASRIHYMGRDPNSARKKVWMFLRWMVRDTPDLGTWKHVISPADLRIPVDVNTGRAFQDLQRVSLGAAMTEQGVSFELDAKGAVASNAANVEAATRVARWFFPDDPVRVDYPFFCYGRRYQRGTDIHRCWKFVDCRECTLKAWVGCRGR